MRIYELLRGKGFDVITVRPSTPVSEAISLLKEYNLGAVVVSNDGMQISGILTERDVVRRLVDGTDFLDSPVSDVMTSEVLTCRPAESVQSLMNTMTEQRIRHLPVVDERHCLGHARAAADALERGVEIRLPAPELGHPDHVRAVGLPVDQVEQAAGIVLELGRGGEQDVRQLGATARLGRGASVAGDLAHG